MRPISFRWHVTIVALLAGCSGGAVPAVAPQQAAPAVHGIAAPASATRGIYVGLGSPGQGAAIYGYRANNKKNKPPMCTSSYGIGADDIAVDRSGNLMIATGSAGQVWILQGPGMCGPLLGKINTNGLPFDVAGADAQNGKIVVGNLYSDTTGFGNVVVCTLSAGCTRTLTNYSIGGVLGVALAKNGDCWASAVARGGSKVVLVYFNKCSGSGQVTNGFTNTYPGGLDIDKHGNLVAIDPASRTFSIFKGCRPGCTLIGGPFTAEGDTYYGHLNKDATQFVAADYQYAQIDVYKYTPTKMTYEYSFNNGLSVSSEVLGAAYNPRSKE